MWTFFGFCCPVSELYAFISALLSHHWSHLSHGIVGVVCTWEFPLKVKHQEGIKYGDGFGRKKRREIIAWLVELGHCFRKLGWAQLQLKRSVAGRETSEMTKCSVFTLDGAMWQHLSMRMHFSKKTSFPPCLDSSHSSHVNPSVYMFNYPSMAAFACVYLMPHEGGAFCNKLKYSCLILAVEWNCVILN